MPWRSSAVRVRTLITWPGSTWVPPLFTEISGSGPSRTRSMAEPITERAALPVHRK